jgi:hypothetical protein
MQVRGGRSHVFCLVLGGRWHHRLRGLPPPPYYYCAVFYQAAVIRLAVQSTVLVNTSFEILINLQRSLTRYRLGE